MIFCVGITHLVFFFFTLKPFEDAWASNIAHIFGKSTPCRLKHLTMKPQRFSMVCSMVVQPGSAGHPGFHFWGRHEIMLQILAPGRAPKNQRRNKKKRNLLFDDPVPYLSWLLIMSSPSSSVMLPVSSSWSSCSVRFSEREGIRTIFRSTPRSFRDAWSSWWSKPGICAQIKLLQATHTLHSFTPVVTPLSAKQTIQLYPTKVYPATYYRGWMDFSQHVIP